MDDLEDKQSDKTGMALSKPHVLVCGSTGSGKSQWLLNYILRTSNTFLKIIMIVAKLEPFNLYLQDKLKDNIQFIIGLEALPPVETFVDSVKMKKGDVINKYKGTVINPKICDKKLKELLNDDIFIGKSGKQIYKTLQLKYIGITMKMINEIIAGEPERQLQYNEGNKIVNKSIISEKHPNS